jgi:hypothetical protein
MAMGLGHLIGSDGKGWYNFWSGLGADIGGLTLLGATFGVYRKHNCHVGGCWRIGKQQVLGTSWVVCHHHHPEGRPTAEQVARVHSRFLEAERAALERATRGVHHDSAAAGAPAGAATDTPTAPGPTGAGERP